MASFLSWKFILIFLAVVLVNVAAFAACFYLGMPSPASGSIDPKYKLIVTLCGSILFPIHLMAYEPWKYSKIGIAIVLLLESALIHVSAGWLSCKRKGKPLQLRNLFRFRAEDLRFRVRDLLVVVTLVCVSCSIYAGWKMWKMRAALHRQALREMGIYCPDGSGHDFQGYYHDDPGGKRVLFNMGTYQRWLASRGEPSMQSLPAELLEIEDVTQLSIEGATSLPAEIAHFSKLRVLNLQDCKLTTLPPEIGKLSDLRVLHLRNNALTTLPPEIGRLTKLEALELGGNPITDAAVEQLTPLKNLERVFRGATKMTKAGTEKLRQALPKCNVY